MAKSSVRAIRGRNPVGWSRRFGDPIPLPDGAVLKTLKEAIAYLAKTVPKAEQDMPEVLAAADAITIAAEQEIAWMCRHHYATGH
jgi:hypothetical protein